MKLVEIKDITNNLDNKRIPLNSDQRAEKETNPLYPYIGANNIMGYINEYIFDEKILCVAEDGGSWGKKQTCSKIYNEKVWVNNHAHVLTAKDNLVLEYLMYYLNYADLSLCINGATRGKLTKSSLNSIKIPLPPLDQQKKIVAILDAADEYRQKTKALIAKYDELTQSLFLDMFGDPVSNPKGWKVYSVEELCEKISVGVVIKPASYYSQKGVIALRSLNIKPYKIDLNEIVYFSEEAHNNNLKKSILRKGDVVVVRTGNTGTAAIIPEELDGANCIDLIIVKVKKEILSPVYICHFLNSERGKELVSGKSVGGIQKHFNVGALKKTTLPLPTFDTQNQFSERVKEIELQKAQAQTSLAKAEELFNSLLQKAFKGELTNTKLLENA